MNAVYSDIKKSAVIARLIPGIACIIFGLLIIIFLNFHLFTYIFSTKPDVFSIPSTEYKKGKWYSCDNNLLYGYYASDSDGRYYLTATADGKYMGFYVYNKDLEDAEEFNSLVAAVDQRRVEYEQHNLDMTSGVMNYKQEDTQTPWYSSTSQDIYSNPANPQDPHGNSPM